MKKSIITGKNNQANYVIFSKPSLLGIIGIKLVAVLKDISWYSRLPRKTLALVIFTTKFTVAIWIKTTDYKTSLIDWPYM
ncbi:MAG: hypothetical protein PHS33_07535 [Candidatus Omnitrophica bacterium]|nr:hypothetical protein [Candidatus Omnitrophota bacterium]